jgi:hypothetical protein
MTLAISVALRSTHGRARGESFLDALAFQPLLIELDGAFP